MSDTSKVIVALLAGVAVGAALGVLFAPDSGEETRDRLGKALKDLGDTIKDLSDEGVEDLRGAVDKVTENVKTSAKKAQDSMR